MRGNFALLPASVTKTSIMLVGPQALFAGFLLTSPFFYAPKFYVPLEGNRGKGKEREKVREERKRVEWKEHLLSAY